MLGANILRITPVRLALRADASNSQLATQPGTGGPKRLEQEARSRLFYGKSNRDGEDCLQAVG